MVLRRIFGTRRDEVPGEWRRLHNGEQMICTAHPVLCGRFKSRRMRWAGHVARMWEKRGLYRVLVGKPKGKRAPGEPRVMWGDNIKMALQEVEWGVGGGGGF